MELIPHAGLVPRRKAPPAGHAGPEAQLLGQVLPLNAGVQNEQDPTHSLPVRHSWPPRNQLRTRTRQQRLNQRPQFVRDDPRSRIPLPHGRTNELASRQSHHPDRLVQALQICASARSRQRIFFRGVLSYPAFDLFPRLLDSHMSSLSPCQRRHPSRFKDGLSEDLPAQFGLIGHDRQVTIHCHACLQGRGGRVQERRK